MTTIYLIRNSVRMPKSSIIEYNIKQSDEIKNEKICISVLGEERAKILCNKEELQNIDAVYTSNCVRTVQTAKYLIEKQNLKFKIDERLNERKLGEKNNNIPKLLEYQLINQEYKNKNGESVYEVKTRFNEAIEEVLRTYRGKRIAVFSHAMAIIYYLTKFCNVISASEEDYGNKVVLNFKDNIVIDEPLNAQQIIKVVFDENNEVDTIEPIDYDDLRYMKGV